LLGRYLICLIRIFCKVFELYIEGCIVLARPIDLILHLFQLANAIKF
jgi:hypothetical protein